ncbi:MAG TPA: isopentenyl-diphosphate Delta-isomerase [Armatimonadota bacterium]|nr:isopentenyl-diphosphate Delta-isomerase [Armatimonadota bacterium]HQK94102.1 isopentenyl-diphosphate Delta-isomerase [Armatimonadota bacterium]
MGQHVVLVNAAGEDLGSMDVQAAHDGEGVRHRAFMVLIRNARGQVLLCRRSAHKRLWPRYWENSCSSHPMPGESHREAAERRLQEELGFTTALEPIGVFEYHALDGAAGAEHEVCAVLTGLHEGDVTPDSAEVEQCVWKDLSQLLTADDTDHWAPWLRPGLEMLALKLSVNRQARG